MPEGRDPTPDSDDATAGIDETTAGIERALSDSQRQERAERNADIARQVSADENLADVLSRTQREPEPE